MDWINPWIELIHGLDWIGSDDCHVQKYDGLSSLMLFQLNRPRLYYVIISDYLGYISMVQFIPGFTNIDYLHCHGFISYQHAALTAQTKSNSETYLMMFSPIE